MHRYFTLWVLTLVTCALPGIAIAQQKTIKEQLVGTWILIDAIDVSPDGTKNSPWGPSPKGTYMFDSDGHFAQMLLRSDLPKFKNRAQGTAEQNKAVVQGSVAMYGTYSINEADKLLTVHFEGSTFAAFNGTEGKRTILSVTAEELRLTNPATSTGTRADSTWQRAK